MTNSANHAPPIDNAWFAPKRFGYGAGLPIAWQGWAMLALHAGLIALGSWLLHLSHPKPWLVAAVIIPFPLYAAKTRGGWKWRWGGN